MYMKKKFLLLILSVFSFGFFGSSSLFAETTAGLKFYTSNTEPKTGEVVEFDLKADATTKLPIATYIVHLKYDKTKLKFQSVSYGEGFTGMKEEEVNDIQNGLIKRTANYPEGLKKLTSVLKYKFVAIAPGKTDIKIVGEAAIDDKNVRNPLQNKNISINISGKALPIEQNVSLEFVGADTFDTVNIYNFSINNKLQVKKEVNATTTVTLVDVNGQEVFRQEKSFISDIDTKLDFNFLPNTLAAGKYTLSAETLFVGQIDANKITKELTVTGEIKKEIPADEENNVWKNILNKVWEFVVTNVIMIAGIIFILFVLRFISKRIRRYRRYDR